jgi:hypothetical protein
MVVVIMITIIIIIKFATILQRIKKTFYNKYFKNVVIVFHTPCWLFLEHITLILNTDNITEGSIMFLTFSHWYCAVGLPFL